MTQQLLAGVTQKVIFCVYGQTCQIMANICKINTHGGEVSISRQREFYCNQILL